MIIELLKRAGSVIRGNVTYRVNSFEHSLSYDRVDGMRIEFSVAHVLQAAGDNFRAPALALCARKTRHNPNATPNALLNLSPEEARLLRDFLNRPEISEWLEEEGEI